MPYTPDANSVAGRVCAFFRVDRTAELSTVEIAQQFGKPSSSIPALLASCIEHQLIARRKDAQLNTLWFAGPKLFHAGAPQPRGVISPVAPKPAAPPVQAPATSPPATAAYITKAELIEAAPRHIPAGDEATLQFARQLSHLQLSLDLAKNATCALLFVLDRVDPELPDDQRATPDEYHLTRRLAKSALAVIERGAA